MASKTEELEFTMHPQLLFDVIQRQAGTLEKAIAEGAMNAADAKATVCNITIAAQRVIIEDDGKGFPSREQIDKFFSVFGTPHTEEEGKVYGTFRMGRGQLFKFGKNNWRSGNFEMNVNIKEWGLKWPLTTHTQSIPGCRIVIDLYDKLSPSMIAETVKEVEHLIKYLEITGTEAYVNGVKVTVDPAVEKWDYTLPEGYVRLRRTGNLDVYNQGVLVKGYPDYQYGTGGVVVASKQLLVNFARNDVMVRDCKVWKTLMKDVGRYARERIEKTPTLNNAERARLAQDVLNGKMNADEAFDARIFTDVCGRHWSAKQIMSRVSSYQYRISLADQGSNVGDTVHKMGLAFILGSDTADRFRKDLPTLVTLLLQLRKKAQKWASESDITAVEFDEVADSLDTRSIIVPEDKWTPSEKLMMTVAARSLSDIAYQVAKANGTYNENVRWRAPRKLLVGSSETMLGWTDGKTYIALDRRMMTLDCVSMDGILKLHRVLLHEQCHDSADTGTHQHTHEFYQVFHDCMDCANKSAVYAFKQVPRMMEGLALKLTPKQLKDLDYLFKAEEGVSKLTQKIAACAGKVMGAAKEPG